MTSEELEDISTKLSDETGIYVIFWYTYSSDEYDLNDPPEEDKTYYVVIKDVLDPTNSNIYFRTYSDNWEKLYEITEQILKVIKPFKDEIN